jgi:hypothetical protein
MSEKAWLRLAGAAILILLGLSVYVAWRGTQREQAQLQEKLNSAEQAVRDANAREESRKVELDQQLSELQKQEAKVQKPEQVVKALPAVLPLPTPLVLQEVAQSPTMGQTSNKDKSNAPSPNVLLPVEDLKPLYDYAVGCKECQAELGVAQADLKDEKVKTQTLGKERDDALRAAKGGSLLKRVARAAKWFALGAAAGAVAAKLAN